MNVKKIKFILLGTLLTMGFSGVSVAEQDSKDGLTLTIDKRSTIAYKKEGVDFSEYTHVLILPSQVAFKKNWKRDYNRDQVGLSGRLKDADIIEIKEGVAKLFDEVFKDEFAKKGDSPLVDKVSAGTLIIKPAVIDLDINAPDLKTANRSRTYINETGKATLYLELYDGVTGEILARVMDAKIVGNHSFYKWANSVTNKADAKRTFRTWAKKLREKFDEVQAK
jgi:hypothetical protein